MTAWASRRDMGADAVFEDVPDIVGPARSSATTPDIHASHEDTVCGRRPLSTHDYEVRACLSDHARAAT